MMLPVTDTMPLPITLSSNFSEGGIIADRAAQSISLVQGFVLEAGTVFNFLDLLPFRTLFGQSCGRGSSTPEHEHDRSKEKHHRAPPEVYIQRLRDALRHDEANDDQENTKH